MTEHKSLLTRMGVCVDTGDILGTNSRIGKRNMRIYFVRL